MKSFALLCIVSVTDALKTESCCTTGNTSCCPKDTGASSAVESMLLDDEQDAVDLSDWFEDVTPNLQDGEVIDEEALRTTRQMFQWMDLDANENIDIINEVEQMLDFDISRNDMSNYEAAILRDYFYDAAGQDGDGTQRYDISFDELYDYNVELVRSGAMKQMFDDFAKNRAQAEQQAAEFFSVFDLNSDGLITIDEYEKAASEAVDKGDMSHNEAQWMKNQVQIADDADEMSDNEVDIEDITERFKILIDDGLEYNSATEGGAMDQKEANQHAQDTADKLWNTLDTNFDGKVSEQESETYANTLSDADAATWRDTFKRADAKDGQTNDAIYYEDLEEVYYDGFKSGDIAPNK